MKDYLLKAVACNEHVRIYICSTTALVEEARTRFDLWPTASAALGRTLTVGSMMGSMLKSDKEQLTIRIKGRSVPYWSMHTATDMSAVLYPIRIFIISTMIPESWPSALPSEKKERWKSSRTWA